MRTVTLSIAAVQNKLSEESFNYCSSLEHDADPSAHGERLLFMTGRIGHVSLDQRFVQLGSPVEFSVPIAWSMELAIQNGQGSVASSLILKGCRLNQGEVRKAESKFSMPFHDNPLGKSPFVFILLLRSNGTRVTKVEGSGNATQHLVVYHLHDVRTRYGEANESQWNMLTCEKANPVIEQSIHPRFHLEIHLQPLLHLVVEGRRFPELVACK